MVSLIDRLLLLFFPFMDVGIRLGNYPLRLGELMFLLSSLRIIALYQIKPKIYLSRKEMFIIIFLLSNLLLTIIVSYLHIDKIHQPFLRDYLIRNVSYTIVVSSFIFVPFKIELFKKIPIMKIIVLVQLIFFGIQFISIVFGLDNDWMYVTLHQGGERFGVSSLYRLAGTASEPGYIVPLLAIPLYYFLQVNREGVWLALTLILIILTFSTYGYLVLVIALFSFLFIQQKSSMLLIRLLKISVPLIIVLIIFSDSLIPLINNFIGKILVFFGYGEMNWSAMQRRGNMILALELFLNSDIMSKFLGSGTGFFAYYIRSFFTGYEVANEAHSYYIATLLERGVIGILLLFLLFYSLKKFKHITYFSNKFQNIYSAFRFGILIRLLQWFTTGNIFQYYFWIEIIIIIAFEAYMQKKKYP